MLDALRAAVDTTDIPPTSEGIAAAVAVRDCFDARIAAAVADAEAAGVYEVDGATSMPRWLAHHGGMSARAAGRVVRRARLVAKLPVTGQRWLEGTLSSGLVDAIVANLGEDTVGLFAEQEAEIVPALVDLSPKDAATAMRRWRDLATADREPPAEKPQRLHLSRGLDNRWVLTRTAPAPLWNALIVRDRHCRFPGCDRPPEWCEAHHVWWWENGGPTNRDNLVMLCVRHHHLLHQKGWDAELLADGAFRVTGPNQRTRTTRPPGITRQAA